MKKRLFAVQLLAVAGSLAAGWLLLHVPDSTAGHLVLSLALMYATLFLLSFGLGATAGSLIEAPETAGFRGILVHGWRGWWRAAGVLLVAAGLTYVLGRLGWLRAASGAAVWVLALLAIPAAIRRPAWQVKPLLRAILYAAVGVALGYGSWQVLSTPSHMGLPWLELAWLVTRVAVAYLLANLAGAILIAAGATTAQPSRERQKP